MEHDDHLKPDDDAEEGSRSASDSRVVVIKLEED